MKLTFGRLRRAFSLLAIVAFIALGLPDTALAEDVEPPALVGLSISPSSVNTAASSQTVKITAHITDNLSGVELCGAQVSFESPGGKQHQGSCFQTRVSGTATDGEYEESVTIPQYSATGKWKVSLFSAYDKVGNSVYYTASQLEAKGFPAGFEVTGEGTGGEEPPPAEPQASIASFSAKPIPGNAGTCKGCGAGFDLELEYVITGSGYGVTPQNPKGGIPPISQINLSLPEGTQEHAAPFGQCTAAILSNVGPGGCPASSAVSPIGSALSEVTFGGTRVPEEAEVRAFLGDGGLLFYQAGHSPVALEFVSAGHYVSDQPPYGEELITQLPPVATVPGAPLASIKTLHIKLGAVTTAGSEVIPYLTFPQACPAPEVSFKTEVVFGGSNALGDFGIPAKVASATLKAPCSAVAPPPPSPSPPPTVASRPTPQQIAALLSAELVPSGKRAKIAALLQRGGFSRTINALEAGALAMYWYEVPNGARVTRKGRPKPVLLASGKVTFPTAGRATIRIKLTSSGKRLLKRAKRVALTAKGTFTPVGQTPISVFRKFTLRR